VAVIEIRDLVKRFKAVTAVDGLSFDVEAGTITGFLGPNGAGKTTTLRSLLGLIRPTSGTATIEGAAYRDLPHPFQSVGAVLEASAFYPGRSGREHLRVMATASGVALARCDELLGLVGLADDADRKVGKYSLGMRQRLHLAASLLGDPRVLILDEPANGLDPAGIVWLRELLRHLALAQGKTILVSSHVLAEVAQTVDNVVIINHGRLIVQAPVGELVGDAAREVRVRTPEVERLRGAIVAAGLRVVPDESAPDRLRIPEATAEQIGRLAFDAGVPVYELVADHGNLEAIFLELTEGPATGPVAGPPLPERVA
jgi:ABC-2 type transport system ATP-binding protein